VQVDALAFPLEGAATWVGDCVDDWVSDVKGKVDVFL
jgi:hypothetical protein